MKIRLTGTKGECDIMVDAIAEAFGEAIVSGEILSTSQFYPWTRNDPDSKIGSVYLEVRI